MTAAEFASAKVDRPIMEPDVRIELIEVAARHRRDLGDLDALMASIMDVGLLQPVVVTRDNRLIAGERRLEACRRLGRETISVTVAGDLTDAVTLLHAERDENTCRKDMLPSELASLGEALYEVEAANAKDRIAEAGRSAAPGRPAERSSLQGGPFPSGKETATAVGEALGMSRSTYSDLRFAHKVANDPHRPDEERVLGREALAQMDFGKGIQPATNELRRRLRAKHEAQVTRDLAMATDATVEPTEADEPWIPRHGDSRPESVERRRVLIGHYAEQGFSSAQIAKQIGMRDDSVRKVARESDIRIPADEAMGRGTRKKIDSNRVMSEIVAAAQGAAIGLDLVAWGDLDRSEIRNWTASLNQSIRVLNQLNQRLKEMVQ